MTRLLWFLATAAAKAPAIADDSDLRLARELTNPFANVVNVPINQNPDFGIGGHGGWRYTLTVQPVIPFAINADWNIISRSVIPLIYDHSGGRSNFGLGNTQQSFFLSPTNAADR